MAEQAQDSYWEDLKPAHDASRLPGYSPIRLEQQDAGRFEVAHQQQDIINHSNDGLRDYRRQLRLVEQKSEERQNIVLQQQGSINDDNAASRDYQMQTVLAEERNEERLELARTQQSPIAQNQTIQDYYIQLGVLERKNEERLRMARQQPKPEMGQNSATQLYCRVEITRPQENGKKRRPQTRRQRRPNKHGNHAAGSSRRSE